MAPPDATVERYSKWVMAGRIVAVTDELGHEPFAVIGHDRARWSRCVPRSTIPAG
jgi:pimeloyl-ACP methyl ester carboxylesterase